MTDFVRAMQDYNSPVPNPLQFSTPGVQMFNLTNNPILSKAYLDGTNSFGSNSVPGAWGDWGSMTNSVVPKTNFLTDLQKMLVENRIIDTIDPATGQKLGGIGNMAIDAAKGIGSLYMGMQQYNLAKEALANSKAQFEKNYAAQAQMINTSLEDRQRTRINSSTPSAGYESVDSYMSKHKVV